MSIYRVDVVVYASLYVRADDADQARARASGLENLVLEVADTGRSEVPICGLRYDDPALPDVSLSPAMTVIGPGDNDEPELAEG